MKNKMYDDFIGLFKNAGISASVAKRAYKEIVVEQATPLAKCKNDIQSISRTLQDHILKALMFPYHDDMLHWKTEIAESACTFCGVRSKNNNKFLTPDLILSSLNIYSEEDMKLRCQNLSEKYDKNANAPSYTSFITFIKTLTKYHRPITTNDVNDILESVK